MFHWKITPKWKETIILEKHPFSTEPWFWPNYNISPTCGLKWVSRAIEYFTNLYFTNLDFPEVRGPTSLLKKSYSLPFGRQKGRFVRSPPPPGPRPVSDPTSFHSWRRKCGSTWGMAPQRISGSCNDVECLGCKTGCMVYWLIECLIHWFIDCLFDLLIHWLVHLAGDMLVLVLHARFLEKMTDGLLLSWAYQVCTFFSLYTNFSWILFPCYIPTSWW